MPTAVTRIPTVQPMMLTRSSRHDRPADPDSDGLAVATPLVAARRPAPRSLTDYNQNARATRTTVSASGSRKTHHRSDAYGLASAAQSIGIAQRHASTVALGV